MRLTVRQKSIRITAPLRAYMEQKIIEPVRRAAEGFGLSDLPILDIDIERTPRHHRKGQVYRVTAALTLGKKMIRAEATEEDPRAACDLLEDELKREIQTYKTRSLTLLKRGARQAKKDLHFARSARMFRKGRIRDEGN